ncbi:hypothetical protein VNO78_11282 [Psophocarpus tetragonolobus]|uniref:J domain-containing protein n=1 Tax=Psophocarpus tetragonolobus TaxID=3891 RepID=A0AAN9SMV6_PSOTE
MRCYGLTLPGSGSGSGRDHRFFVPKLYPSRPINRISFPRATLKNQGFTVDLSFYELLGIPESGSLTEIKTAYKQLARKYHPDVSPPGRVQEYTERFIQVQEAYETLSDPSLRAMYDNHISKGVHFAFNARLRSNYHHQVVEQKVEWKSRWQSQLSGLKRRSNSKDGGENMSWAARVRQQKEEELSSES